MQRRRRRRGMRCGEAFETRDREGRLVAGPARVRVGRREQGEGTELIPTTSRRLRTPRRSSVGLRGRRRRALFADDAESDPEGYRDPPSERCPAVFLPVVAIACRANDLERLRTRHALKACNCLIVSVSSSGSHPSNEARSIPHYQPRVRQQPPRTRRKVQTCVHGFTNRRTKFTAVSATSRQPWSIVSECPRSGIWTISVTPLLRRCFL
ncbi:MAG: hypothetical protein JWL83_599 [Actinomycetia bacterium]|nr:hypothetical protein [Actinomycetes bacterium]